MVLFAFYGGVEYGDIYIYMCLPLHSTQLAYFCGLFVCEDDTRWTSKAEDKRPSAWEGNQAGTSHVRNMTARHLYWVPGRGVT